MRFTTYISSVTIAAASLVRADCYGSGESWGGESFQAVAAVQTLCSDSNYRSFANLEFKTRCINLSSVKKADFTITMGPLNWPIQISENDCNDRLKREILGCEHGGRSTYTINPPTDGIPEGGVLNPVEVNIDFM